MIYKKISKQTMSREEWLKARRSGIGGSDAGAVLGLSKWGSPMSVFADKTGRSAEKEMTEAMRLGTDLEELVARRFTEETGKRVRKSNFIFRSKEHPFMIADVDRMVCGEDSGLECKTANMLTRYNWAEGDIPPQYYVQCQHYMAVTGAKRWYLAAMVLGRGYYVYPIDRDEGEISTLTELEEAFWVNHVLSGTPPAEDGTDATDAVIRHMFKGDAALPAVDLSAKSGANIAELMEVQAQMKSLEAREKMLKQAIQMEMGDAVTGYSGDYVVNWKPVESRRIDSKRIKSELPDVYEQFSKVSKSRRFDIKQVKGA